MTQKKKQYGKELPLLAILTHGDSQPTVGRDILIQKAMKGINGMVSFKNEGSFSILTVRANEPLFARDVNKAVLTELQELNRFFKSQKINRKVDFFEIMIDIEVRDINHLSNIVAALRLLSEVSSVERIKG